jgi:hypothetical protein
MEGPKTPQGKLSKATYWLCDLGKSINPWEPHPLLFRMEKLDLLPRMAAGLKKVPVSEG